MAKKGLNATDYRGWIQNDIEIHGFTTQLFSEFVIGTPAFGLSKKGRDLYEYYKYNVITDYNKLKKDLVGEIPFNSYETYEILKQEITKDDNMNFKNDISDALVEAIYIYSGAVLIVNFIKIILKPILQKKARKRMKLVKKAPEEKVRLN